jgi:hypothetical protein
MGRADVIALEKKALLPVPSFQLCQLGS